jgi:hypothetical protein
LIGEFDLGLQHVDAARGFIERQFVGVLLRLIASLATLFNLNACVRLICALRRCWTPPYFTAAAFIVPSWPMAISVKKGAWGGGT